MKTNEKNLYMYLASVAELAKQASSGYAKSGDLDELRTVILQMRAELDHCTYLADEIRLGRG
jgi:hypothetical protein